MTNPLAPMTDFIRNKSAITFASTVLLASTGCGIIMPAQRAPQRDTKPATTITSTDNDTVKPVISALGLNETKTTTQTRFTAIEANVNYTPLIADKHSSILPQFSVGGAFKGGSIRPDGSQNAFYLGAQVFTGPENGPKIIPQQGSTAVEPIYRTKALFNGGYQRSYTLSKDKSVFNTKKTSLDARITALVHVHNEMTANTQTGVGMGAGLYIGMTRDITKHIGVRGGVSANVVDGGALVFANAGIFVQSQKRYQAQVKQRKGRAYAR